MPNPNSIQRRGLRPDVSNERVYDQRVGGRGDLGARIQELANVLDPAGSGAMARYLQRKDEEALATAKAAFQQNNEVTEVSIIQENPHLFGTSKVMGRALSHMRGSKAGRDAIQAARVTAIGTGLDRQTPEDLGNWLETERLKVIDASGGDSDWQRAFNNTWAGYSRQLVDQSLPKHVDAMEDEYRATGSADNTTEFDFAHTVRQYDHLPETFAAKLNSSTLLGRDRGVEESLILDDLKTHLVSNPDAGAGAVEALANSGVFTSSDAKLQLAQLHDYAVENKLKAEAADSVATEQLALAQLNDVTGKMLSAVGNGPEAVTKLYPQLARLDPAVATKAMTNYSKALELSQKHEDSLVDEGSLIDLERAIRNDPGYDVSDLLDEGNLTREALKRGGAAIEARDKGLAGIFSFASVKRGTDRLKSQPAATADFTGGSIPDPERLRLYQEAVATHSDMMWEWVKANPNLASNAELAGRQSDVYADALIKNIDAIRPPPAPEIGTAAKPADPTITAAGIGQAVLERERTLLTERARASAAATATGSITGRHPNADGVWTRSPLIGNNLDMVMSAAMGLPGTFESIQAPAAPAPPAAAAPSAPAPASAPAAEVPPEQAMTEAERVYGKGTVGMFRDFILWRDFDEARKRRAE